LHPDGASFRDYASKVLVSCSLAPRVAVSAKTFKKSILTPFDRVGIDLAMNDGITGERRCFMDPT